MHSLCVCVRAHHSGRTTRTRWHRERETSVTRLLSLPRKRCISVCMSACVIVRACSFALLLHAVARARIRCHMARRSGTHEAAARREMIASLGVVLTSPPARERERGEEGGGSLEEVPPAESSCTAVICQSDVKCILNQIAVLSSFLSLFLLSFFCSHRGLIVPSSSSSST